MTVGPASLVTQVYDDLRRRITEQRLGGGEKLGIMSLARDFGISPTPIREALARLHADGLIDLLPNKGYRVAHGPDADSTQQWMEARVVLETNTLRLAGGRVDAAVVSRLQALNDRMTNKRFGGAFEDVRAFAELNSEFHRTLVEAAGNPFLVRAWEQVALTAQFSRIHYRNGVRHQALITAEHQTVIDALGRSDLEMAVGALHRHIVDSLERDRNSNITE